MKEVDKLRDIQHRYPLHHLLRDLWHYGARYRTQLVAYTGIIVISALVTLTPAYMYGRIVDTLTKGAYATVPSLLLAIAASYITQNILENYVSYRTKILAAHIVHDTRIATINHLFKQDFAFFETTSLGQLLNRANDGSKSFKDVVRIFYSTSFSRLFTMLFASIVMLKLYFPAGILTVLTLALFWTYGTISTKTMLGHEHHLQEESEKTQGKLYDFLRHIQIIKFLNLKDTLVKKIDNTFMHILHLEADRRRHERIKVALSAAITNLGSVIILGTSAYGIINGKISLGIGLSALQYYNQINGNLWRTWNDYNELLPIRTSVYRLNEIYTLTPTINEPTRPLAIPSKWKTINFEHVTFTYPSKKTPALKHVTFRINQGERVAIVGATGSGKSTVSKLLLRLYEPQQGTITIGNTPVNQIASKELFGHIRIVPQENELINTTIYENLAIVNSPLPRKKALTLLQNMQLSHFLKHLPNGIDTIVGPDGIRVSGGEKQRICLARAILTQPEVLLLDEATSHLDVITEKRIYEQLAKLPKKTTVIAIIHRISSVYLFDRVIVMNQGKVVGQGTHTELLKANHYYQELWKTAHQQR